MDTDLEPLIRHGVVEEVFRAQQAHLLFRTVQEHASSIEAAGFGELFGTLQSQFQRTYCVAVCAVFEKSSARFLLRSLPAVVDHLERTAEDLPVAEVAATQRFVESLTAAAAPEEGPELTRALANALRLAMPDPSQSEKDARSATLARIKLVRDKLVAHREDVPTGGWTLPPWEACDDLLSFAKRAVGAISHGYLSSVYVTADGTFVLDSNAGRVRSALQRLLKQAGIDNAD